MTYRRSALSLGVPPKPFFLASLLLLAMAFFLGGASRQNAIPAAIVEWAALCLLPWAIWRLAARQGFSEIRLPLVIIALMLLIPAAQLIPFPPEVWRHFPDQEQVLDIYRTAGIEPPWRPLSLTPELTLKSGLALIPAISVFLSWATLSNSERRLGVVLVLAVVVLSLVIGVVQVAGNGAVGYLYTNTNTGSLVGFFSNRNHQASLLLCVPALLAGLYASVEHRREGLRILAVISLGFGLASLLALAAVRSRAGILLLTPALIGSAMLLLRSAAFKGSKRMVLVIVIPVAVALVLVGFLGLAPLLDRFSNDIADDLRFAVAPFIWNEALARLPFGSGLGSFDSVFRTVEPLNLVGPAFVNHAHNDYLQIVLETGVIGAAVVALFLAWLFSKIWKVWLDREGRLDLARAGTIVIALLLAHSAVDYPLRTIALSSLLAFSCALLVRTHD